MPKKPLSRPAILDEDYVVVDLPQQRIIIQRLISITDLRKIVQWFEQQFDAKAVISVDATFKWDRYPTGWHRVQGEVTKIGSTKVHVNYYKPEGDYTWCAFRDTTKTHPEAPFVMEISSGNVVQRIYRQLGITTDKLATLLSTTEDEIKRCVKEGVLPEDAEALRMLQVIGDKFGIKVPTPEKAKTLQEQRADEVAETLADILLAFKEATPKLDNLKTGLKEKKQLLKRGGQALSNYHFAGKDKPQE